MEYKPSEQFFNWMIELGVIRANDEDATMLFWIKHVNDAHNWYGHH